MSCLREQQRNKERGKDINRIIIYVYRVQFPLMTSWVAVRPAESVDGCRSTLQDWRTPHKPQKSSKPRRKNTFANPRRTRILRVMKYLKCGVSAAYCIMSYHIIIATNMRLAEGSPKQSTVTFLAVLCEVLQSPHLVAPASPWTPKHPAQLQLHLPSFTLIGLIGILQSCTNFSTDPSRRKQSTWIIQPIGCSHLILWRRVGGWGDQLFQDQVARAELVVSGRLCRLGYRTLQGTRKDIPPEKGKSSTQKCRLLDGDMWNIPGG